MICNYIYSDLHSFVAYGPCNYCIELWLTLGVFLMKLLWIFLMLVLDMNYFNWIVKNEKYIGPLGCFSHALDLFGFGAWQRRCLILILCDLISSTTLVWRVGGPHIMTPTSMRPHFSNISQKISLIRQRKGH